MEGWEAVGRTLVKGYVSISYFPTFLSKACLYIHTCIHTNIHTSLFNNAGYENWQEQNPDMDLANYS